MCTKVFRVIWIKKGAVLLCIGGFVHRTSFFHLPKVVVLAISALDMGRHILSDVKVGTT